MIVVMKRSATDADINAMIAHVEAKGLKPNVIKGSERTVIAVVGDERIAGMGSLESGPGVDEVLRPAVIGATSLATAVPEVVADELAGAAFVDETGEPVGAILVPADVEAASDEIVPLLAQLSIAISLARANMRAEYDSLAGL